EVALGTLQNYSKLLTNFGGYQRLEDDLSLTGESKAGTYDTSEWILLDLRIGEAWRRTGDADNIAWADALLDKVTEHALANDHLVPELYDRETGAYAGVVPMVGYGAGAWMMAQLEKYGSPPPTYDAGFAHCDGAGSDGGDVTPSDPPPGTTPPGVEPPGDDTPTPAPDEPEEEVVDLGDEPAMICSGVGSGGAPWGDLALLALASGALFLWRRRLSLGGAA
ncbi:MAG: hypothetical protein VX938_07295, partial [Myxococcota bacterium]|nr:hypothetical protein [Myxococcota bacterium]